MRIFYALSVILTTVGCTPPKPRQASEGLVGLRHGIEVGFSLNAKVSYLRSATPADVTVIWVHGTPGSAEGWTDYLLDPVPGTVSVALDRPGFGESGPLGPVTSLERQAVAVEALFPPTPKAVVVVGHSLGGAVAALVAARNPQRVSGLVLLASSLDPAMEVIHPMQYVAKAWPVSRLLPRALRNANEELMNFKVELLSLQPMLASIAAPTVIVHGTKDDLVPFANVAYMQLHLKGVRCLKTRVLDGQNHFLPWNSEAIVRESVRWAVSQGADKTERCE